MDRSKELRVLMKQKASTAQSSAGTTAQFDSLSGKEKAKLIKALRDKQRQESEAQEAALKRHAPTHFPTHTLPLSNPNSAPKPVKVVSFHANQDSGPANDTSIPHKNNGNVSPPSLESNLPDGFFDEPIESFNTNSLISENALPSANAEMSAALKETYENAAAAAAPQISANSAGYSRRNEAITAVMTTNSLLPSGFFDDPEADSKARGIDTTKIAEVLDRQAEEDLQRLLNEVSDLPSVEDIEESDLQTQEFEEKATQLAYMTRVAALMHHASSASSASDPRHQQQEHPQLAFDTDHQSLDRHHQRIDDTLAEAQNVISFNQSSRLLSSGASSSSSDGKSADISSGDSADIESDIERIFRLKREAKKKRKREEEALLADVGADAGFYGEDFMDNIDWMARSI